MSIRLLIAEDTMFTAFMMRAQIHHKDPDIETRVCATFSDTISTAVDFKPDVIILDLGLPDSTTEETLKSIGGLKAASPFSKILATTAATHVTEEEVLKAGADDFMPKIIGRSGGALLSRITDLCKPSY